MPLILSTSLDKRNKIMRKNSNNLFLIIRRTSFSCHFIYFFSPLTSLSFQIFCCSHYTSSHIYLIPNYSFHSFRKHIFAYYKRWPGKEMRPFLCCLHNLFPQYTISFFKEGTAKAKGGGYLKWNIIPKLIYQTCLEHKIDSHIFIQMNRNGGKKV